MDREIVYQANHKNSMIYRIGRIKSNDNYAESAIKENNKNISIERNLKQKFIERRKKKRILLVLEGVFQSSSNSRLVSHDGTNGKNISLQLNQAVGLF